MKKAMVSENRPEQTQRNNGLFDVCDGLGFPGFGSYNQFNGIPGGWGGIGYGPPRTIAQPWTLGSSNSWGLLSNNRMVLAQSYGSQGIAYSVINLPVDDAFSVGFNIKTDELDEEEIAELVKLMNEPNVFTPNRLLQQAMLTAGIDPSLSDIEAVKETRKWAKLYGGAGMIINTPSALNKQFNIEALKQDEPVSFIPADRWELTLNATNVFASDVPFPFSYYGMPLSASRVVRILGVPAPSLLRAQLQGWGMSELERCLRQINSFDKFENVVFEIMDELKIDVWKIENLNTSLMSNAGSRAVIQRVMMANFLKNYHNAAVMDSKDDFDHKQLTLAGFAETYDQLRTNLSGVTNIPKGKLFGESAEGFGSGGDSQQNYDALVSSGQTKCTQALTEVVKIRCKQKYGFIPEDLCIEWNPVTQLDGLEEQDVNDKKQKRALDLFDRNLLDGKETMESLKKDGLVNVDSQVLNGDREVEPMAMMQMEQEGEQFDESLKAQERSEKTAAKTERRENRRR